MDFARLFSFLDNVFSVFWRQTLPGTDRGNRVNAMRAAICESFPEPNRRLLQR